MKIFICILISLLSHSLLASELLSGKVVDLKGTATLTKSNTNLKVGDVIHEGDKVATGERSRLRLLLNTEAAIQLGPKSEFELKKEESGPILIELLRGTVLSRIKPSAQNDTAEKYKVKIQGVVLAVRGTSFFVAQEKEANPIYVCFCQGTIDFHMNHIAKTLKTKHHDVEYWIKGDQIRFKGKDITHTDQDISELGDILIKH